MINLPRSRQIGFAASRGVIEAESLSHDCQIGADALAQLQPPAQVEGQRVAALRFGQGRVQALSAVLVSFRPQPNGFRNKQLRPLLAQCLGLADSDLRPGRMSYEPRRLCLRRLIECLPRSHRYSLTLPDMKPTLIYARVH